MGEHGDGAYRSGGPSPDRTQGGLHEADPGLGFMHRGNPGVAQGVDDTGFPAPRMLR